MPKRQRKTTQSLCLLEHNAKTHPHVHNRINPNSHNCTLTWFSAGWESYSVTGSLQSCPDSGRLKNHLN